MAAVTALLGAFATAGEAALPDVHDGDSSRAVSVSAAGSSELSAPAAPQAPVPCHSTHVEHCGHSHLVLVAAPASFVPSHSRVKDSPTLAAIAPASVPRAPEQRPPIV